MKIYVDADACPVVKIVERLAKKYDIPCALLCDTNHVISSDCCSYQILQRHPEITRSASKRGYGSRWQRISREYLQAHPLCVRCMKKEPPRYVKTTVVDHIIPHRGDQKLFWDRGNWQALCKSGHDEKTLKEDLNPVYRY